MIGFGINSILAKFSTLNYFVGAVKNEDIYILAWEGVQGTFFAFVDKWVCCPMAYSTCQVCSLVTQFRDNPLVSSHFGPDSDKILIDKAKSDNTDLFCNFTV